eukprot:gene54280-74339_t
MGFAQPFRALHYRPALGPGARGRLSQTGSTTQAHHLGHRERLRERALKSLDASASNPQTFPKFIPSFNRVVTFREMINWCIENPQGGKPLNVNGPEMTAMEAYAFNLHRG